MGNTVFKTLVLLLLIGICVAIYIVGSSAKHSGRFQTISEQLGAAKAYAKVGKTDEVFLVCVPRPLRGGPVVSQKVAALMRSKPQFAMVDPIFKGLYVCVREQNPRG